MAFLNKRPSIPWNADDTQVKTKLLFIFYPKA